MTKFLLKNKKFNVSDEKTVNKRNKEITYFYPEKKIKNNIFNYPVKALKVCAKKLNVYVLKNRGSTKLRASLTVPYNGVLS